jgi:hypothetical protein
VVEASMSEPAPVLDVRTYKLGPGGREEFDRIFCEGALPMLRRAGISVVGYGPSIVDDAGYFLMRSFESTTDREEQLGSFYGNNEWRESYEDAVMALIENYHTIVIPLNAIDLGRLDG